MKICEIFTSIQGEGRYQGFPMLFIRTSGCTRKCSFCDTKYHVDGITISVKELCRRIRKSNRKYVCFTGGEPLLQRNEIYEVIEKCKGKQFHIETNGDLLEPSDLYKFEYFSCSPKDLETAKEAKKYFRDIDDNYYDIKVVTDLKTTGREMIPFATTLMPLTYTQNDQTIQEKVWKYCVKNNIRFCGRLQYYVWGKKKGV